MEPEPVGDRNFMAVQLRGARSSAASLERDLMKKKGRSFFCAKNREEQMIKGDTRNVRKYQSRLGKALGLYSH